MRSGNLLIHVIYIMMSLYSVVPIRFTSKSKSGHVLYYKEHNVRGSSRLTPADRTIFVLNVPPYCNQVSVQKSRPSLTCNFVNMSSTWKNHADVNIKNISRHVSTCLFLSNGTLNTWETTKWCQTFQEIWQL